MAIVSFRDLNIFVEFSVQKSHASFKSFYLFKSIEINLIQFELLIDMISII